MNKFFAELFTSILTAFQILIKSGDPIGYGGFQLSVLSNDLSLQRKDIVDPLSTFMKHNVTDLLFPTWNVEWTALFGSSLFITSSSKVFIFAFTFIHILEF